MDRGWGEEERRGEERRGEERRGEARRGVICKMQAGRGGRRVGAVTRWKEGSRIVLQKTVSVALPITPDDTSRLPGARECIVMYTAF